MNLYKAPSSSLVAEDAMRRHRAAYFLLALALLHGLWLGLRAGGILALVGAGVIAPMAAIAGLLGAVLLYVGALRCAVHCLHGSYWFFTSAVWSAMCVLMLGWRTGVHWPFSAAVPLALAGWALVRHCHAQTATTNPKEL